MHDLMWALYWIDVLSRVGDHLAAGAFLGVFVGVGMWFILDLQREGPRASSFVIGYAATVLVSFMLAFIPSKGTMYAMLSVKTTENVVQSDIGQKLQLIIGKELDNWIGKLISNKQEN